MVYQLKIKNNNSLQILVNTLPFELTTLIWQQYYSSYITSSMLNTIQAIAVQRFNVTLKPSNILHILLHEFDECLELCSA